ncbi:hypothetical protein [Dietzia sp. PP-33]|uniref:hypothetical protein n=1 Tax=Dietzia sp. PP-33 TaxID=2957500 RepID=UPI0029A1CF85|nr:hypothetical protein [Dietzia sp. PP-33]MDX2358168.1 cytochrome P450 [Dietzia sp. PP-33]
MPALSDRHTLTYWRNLYAVHEDPYPFYARLRAEAPVYHNPELDFWALSKGGFIRLLQRRSREAGAV